MRRTVATTASVIALMAAAPAWAQGGQGTAAEDQDIVVTATLRSTSLQDVPFSINAQTEEDIQRSAAVTIEDLSRNIAGLTVQNLGPGQSQVAIRGVSAGQVVRDQPGVKEQVGVYLDDSVISLSLFTPDLDLFDLNRVETLRGPQGTLFGAGSVGGTLRYITNQPRLGQMEGMIEGNVNLVEGGDFGGALRGMINAPLGDTAAVRAVAYYTQYGGFVDAVGPAGGNNVNDGHRVGGRIALRWEPVAGLSITPRFIYQQIRADGFNRQEVFNLYSNQFTTPARTYDERQQYLLLREAFEDDTLLADLNVTADLGPVTLTSVTTYINRDIVVSRDASALTGSVSIDLAFPPASYLLPSNLVDTTDLETFAQEVRLSSSGSGPFQWLVGAFYSEVDRFYRQRLPTPGYGAAQNAVATASRLDANPANDFPFEAQTQNGFPNDSPYNSDLPYDIRQTAIFGEASYTFGRLTATAGGRYYDFREERSFRSGGVFSNGDNRTDQTESSGFSPRFILSWEAADNVRLNAQVSKGFRLGGVNDPLNLPLCSPADAALFGGFQDYDDETLWNYEVGVRAQRRNFRASAAAFYTEINNLQTTLDAGSCSSRIVFNVPEAHTMGVEFEIGVTPLPGLDLSIAGSLIEAEFDSTLPGVLAANTGIREGNRLPSVPNIQIAASANYNFRVNDSAEAYVGATFQHVGSRYTQPSDQESNPRTFVSGLPFAGATGAGQTVLNLRLPDYQYVNLSAGIEWRNGLGVQVYVNNLLDENAILSFDRERGGRARLGFNIGQPRIIGLTVRQRFGGR